MWKKKKLPVILVVCFFLLPIIALSGFFFFKADLIEAPKQTVQELFMELRSLYAQGKIDEAKVKMEPLVDELLALDEGCELVISVYVGAKDYSKLESYSKKCLKMSNSGIAYEGLAMSSISLKKEKEVMEYLESLLKSGENHDRLLVALAQLSYEQGNYIKAQKYFKELIENSSLWSAWILRIIQYDRLFQDKKFVEDFTLLVSNKKNIPKKAADHLLAHAKRHNLDPSVKALTKNLEEQIG